ncbi:hypothetical protein BT96DRAFT_946428 [Gymnopus androsaceus JB14]|uniref:Uncharacterized protein n=1 Tax=Gymnopus androsaceus JB14 TaxID=1447944 RepID=A0A6A4GW78_9AGAR|nr:hypothetical protein BT96DRAFT_946428 [Gymnopus androsaceus JB14]
MKLVTTLRKSVDEKVELVGDVAALDRLRRCCWRKYGAEASWNTSYSWKVAKFIELTVTLNVWTSTFRALKAWLQEAERYRRLEEGYESDNSLEGDEEEDNDDFEPLDSEFSHHTTLLSNLPDLDLSEILNEEITFEYWDIINGSLPDLTDSEEDTLPSSTTRLPSTSNPNSHPFPAPPASSTCAKPVNAKRKASPMFTIVMWCIVEVNFDWKKVEGNVVNLKAGDPRLARQIARHSHQLKLCTAFNAVSE